MKEKDISYFGLKPTIEESVNYGLVVSNERSDEYHCYFKNSDADGYDEGFFCESDINDLIMGKSWFTHDQISTFLHTIKQERDVFLSLNFIQKLDYLISFLGTSNIFGDPIYEYTEKEVLEFINN